MNGRVRAVFLAQQKRTPMRRVLEARALEGHGLEGCRHAKRKHGGKRQVLLMDATHVEALNLEPGALKENLLVEGIDLEALPPGQRLQIGEVKLELTGPCVPCSRLNELRPGLLKESWGRRGQLAKVLIGGIIREGDPITLLDVNPDAPRIITPKLP